MKKNNKTQGIFVLAILIMSLSLVLISCKNTSKQAIQSTNELGFDTVRITDSARFWWAHMPALIDEDNLADLVFISNNANGGYLAYLKGSENTDLWQKVIIAEQTPDGNLFASGDLECGDMDFDGDIDIIAVDHTGEWDEAGAAAKIYYYENPTWTPHYIGEVPDAVKDINMADFNKDEKMDVAILTFDESTLSVFAQENPDSWEKVFYVHNFGNLHEGMDVGDINGDSFTDIAADGYVFYNPARDLTSEWKHENIDPTWNTQEGDWSRNATKHFVTDLDGDGKSEIFISHSERSGYPVAWYQKDESGTWVKNIIADSIPACHTLQVFDFDLDGDLDVLTGVNKGRAVNLDKTSFPVVIYLNNGDNLNWTPYEITQDGIYNGRAIDFDSDGDIDIFRYPSHEATDLFLWINQTL